MDSSPETQGATSLQGLMVPLAIVAAGGLIALSLYFSGGTGNVATNPTNDQQPTKGSVDTVPPVTASDHIYGNPNAPVKIIEYTDLECPFCKAFHVTMKQIVDQYGSSGKVAWVLRNFPLQQLHPNAPKLAEAAECVASVGGNDAYWKFLDAAFKEAPINTLFDLTKLDATVSSVGVDVAKFETCYKAEKFRDKITKEFNDAVASGGQGTPHNILISAKGEKTALPGAQPFATIQAAIESALKN